MECRNDMNLFLAKQYVCQTDASNKLFHTSHKKRKKNFFFKMKINLNCI